MMLRNLIVACLLPVAMPVTAQVPLTEFLGPHGCAIGPSTEAAALEAGFEQAVIDALKEGPDVVRSGHWAFLPEPICQISLPQVVSEISLDDPDIQPAISAPDAFLEFEEPGCFLEGLDVVKLTMLSRGWDREKAFQAYTRFIAAGILSGELRFYSDDPLRTPPGFQVLHGSCAEATATDEILENHGVLRDVFVPFIETAGRPGNAADCADGDVFGTQSGQILEELSKWRNTNAHLSFEMQLITFGAGWYEGMSSGGMGTPRPPLCGVSQE